MRTVAVFCVLSLAASLAMAQTTCPPNSTINGQSSGTAGGTYFYSDLEFCNPDPPNQCRRVTAENFPVNIGADPPLTEPIELISWYGSYIDATQNGCTKPSHAFRIQFYLNDDIPGSNAPKNINTPVASFNVTAEARVVDTITWSGGGFGLKYLFWVALPAPVSLGKGHVSICGTGDPDCWFLWGHSTDGTTAKVHRWYETEMVVAPYTQNNVAFCLGKILPGACCDDWSGNCENNSNDFFCYYEAKLHAVPPAGRFTTGNCGDLDPACGQLPGACCKADQTCTPGLTRAACEAITGAYWRGPTTVCDDCCWIPACPGGAHVEAENCGQNTNAGCGVEPNVFETIEPGGFVCGTTWAEGGAFDEDWYEFTLTQQAEFLLQNVETQIPIRLTPHFSEDHGPPTCDDLWYYVATLFNPCETGTFAPPDVWPKGRYWLHLNPEDADGPVNDFYPCNTANEYYFELVVEYITCPDPCNIPGAQVVPEGEPDYCTTPAPDTFNSGCDQLSSPPGPALPITDNFVLWCGVTGWYDLPSQVCPGDLDCNDFVDFGDINPFVLALSNWSQWLQTYPDCPPENADVNKDGIYGGANGFGDINPFVALLASGGGNPIPCFQDRDLVPDTDWYSFEVKNGPKEVSFFVYPESPMMWEVYLQSAGCEAPPIERREIAPCLSVSKKTYCLPVGKYWLRMVPDANVECGKEYALGLEEFVACELCNADCEAGDVPENENCGEHLNDVCNTQAMPIEPKYDLEKVVCGTIYNLLAPTVEADEDWYKFDTPANQYLVVVLNSDFPITPWMTINGCTGTGWLTQDGIGCDPLGDLNGFFVDKADIPNAAQVDLEITTSLYNPDEGGWYDQPGHFPCPNQYRMLAGYTPTEPTADNFPGIKWHKMTLQGPSPSSYRAAKVEGQ